MFLVYFLIKIVDLLVLFYRFFFVRYPNNSPLSFFMETENAETEETQQQQQRPFAIKRWNLVSTWSWDVECDTCAICRVHLMEACLRCQADSKAQECVVIWGECNHCFHLCCMSLWVKQNNRCPLCQSDWAVQRVGK